MANYEATRYDFDGANLTGIEGVNTGIVVPWGSASIPSGFLLCDGTAVSRSTYANLFSVISTTYGVGDGSTTFNVPDLQDRTICGSSVANSKSLAQTVGANAVTPTGNIAGSTGSTTLSTNQIPSHNHSGSVLAGSGNQNFSGMEGSSTSSGIGSTGGGGSHDHTLSASFAGSANLCSSTNFSIKLYY
jgi:microcystin-dependent protein